MRDDIDLHSLFVHCMLTQTLSNSFVETSNMDARLQVYRRNFMQGHCTALKKTFTVTAEYLGNDFEALAVSYVCQNRPKADQLFATFGDNFIDFLTDSTAKELALLEWELQTIAMAKYDECQMPVHPDKTYWQLRSDVRLFQSHYNVGDVYRDIQTPENKPTIIMGSHNYILYCKNEIPMIKSLSPKEYTILDQLRTPKLIDELFDELTFCQETIVNILPNVFNVNFLKGTDVNAIHPSKVYTNV